MLKSFLGGFNRKQNASVKLRRRYQMNFIRDELTTINFLRIFGTRSIKTLKNLTNLTKFQSTSILAIGSDRRQETLSVPSNSIQ